MGDVCIIIPAYNPSNQLFDLIKGLYGYDILVVNDGSDNGFLFEELNCVVVEHERNLGKGAALKTAFQYILKSNKKYLGIVTADCDGQHSPEDIRNITSALYHNPDKLIMGVRNFNIKTTPLRSLVGNKLTSYIFKKFYKINLSDTQTGLRGIPYDLLRILTEVSGLGFDYETKVLFELKKYNIEFKEYPIRTIYIKNNYNSHFDPIIDSIKIYSKIFAGRK